MVAKVYLWNKIVGYVLWDDNKGFATFEFDPEFVKTDFDISPLIMPIDDLRNGQRIFSFPDLERKTFLGLPGLLVDSLPDRFGNKMLNAWLAKYGKSLTSVNPVERLCYACDRAMGALEFEPVLYPEKKFKSNIEIEDMVQLVDNILAERTTLESNLHNDGKQAITSIIRIGTSAGGARPKAVITYNENSGEIRSGHIQVPEGFSHWIIKLDGVKENELGETKGYGRIEYAYYLMARDCGITIEPCKLLEESGRAHFMTKRFDREKNEKLHMQSLCAIAHYDYNNPDAYSYEQAFQVMRRMLLPYTEAKQLFIRMVFNVIAMNNDDHTKNISFLMDKNGKWKLSPAYDLIFAFNPENFWLRRHQMSVNGKRSEINRKDLLHVAKEMNIKHAGDIIDKIVTVVSNWKKYAEKSGLNKEMIRLIERSFNLSLY
ncbi:MAG: type II toxin-antitoxin system HipA family toxin [Bacteroidales bacterium]|nr:type II toxin-antitoxin system HipA family toxin [Bacteroidales bacterium]